MDVAEKLEILADAAKFDVACTSSGIDRNAQAGRLGSTMAAGCCHSFTPDGRCICLLKVLFTNVCLYDCAYCNNRASNDIPRATFAPRELADLTIAFYRRNYIEGLFLSSGVVKSPDYTSELLAQTLEILRNEYGFRGYIHAKAIPGTSPEIIDKLGRLADRMSVNMELPSQQSLNRLAPEKSSQSLIAPMRRIAENIAEDRESHALMRRKRGSINRWQPPVKERAYVPAGQSTQMIVGATPETDYTILNLSSALYQRLNMKRVFFSAYVPVNRDKRLPDTADIPLDREHRLFQADWLMRFYGFSFDEIIDENAPMLDLLVDPKANWALNHLDEFPVEVNRADYEMLMRVPGIGVTGARRIMAARRAHALGEVELKRCGIVLKRARYFITCNGAWLGGGIDYSRESLRAVLAQKIDGGSHGRRSPKRIPGQMSLEELEPSFNTSLPAKPIDATAVLHHPLPPSCSSNPNQALEAKAIVARSYADPLAQWCS